MSNQQLHLHIPPCDASDKGLWSRTKWHHADRFGAHRFADAGQDDRQSLKGWTSFSTVSSQVSYGRVVSHFFGGQPVMLGMDVEDAS